MENTECACESCNCSGNEVRADGYCSDSCSGGNEAAGHCACNHAGCGK